VYTPLLDAYTCSLAPFHIFDFRGRNSCPTRLTSSRRLHTLSRPPHYLREHECIRIHSPLLVGTLAHSKSSNNLRLGIPLYGTDGNVTHDKHSYVHSTSTHTTVPDLRLRGRREGRQSTHSLPPPPPPTTTTNASTAIPQIQHRHLCYRSVYR
jgi:hypothetical protein